MAVIPLAGRGGLEGDTAYGKPRASLCTAVVAAAQPTASENSYLDIITKIKRQASYIPGPIDRVRFPRTVLSSHD